MNSVLLLLLDSRAPVGGHGHSGGMEPAVDTGLVRDPAEVEAFCAGRLRTTGRVAAAFAAAAANAWHNNARPEAWRRLDDEFDARTPAGAERFASRALGRGVLRLLAAMAPDADVTRPWRLIAPTSPHQPIAVGAGCAIAGGTAVDAARAAALHACTAPAVAAIRLLGLDPYGVHGMLARLAPAVDRIADEAAASAAWDDPAALPATCAPALEILADVHTTKEARLFAS